LDLRYYAIAYAVVYGAALLYGCFFLRFAGPIRPLAFALAWTALEFAKSTGFLGYPWGLLAYSFTDVPLMLQTADIWGVYGISSFLALCTAVLGEYCIHKGTRLSLSRIPLQKWALVAALWALFLLGYGELSLKRSYPVKDTVRLILCQQNIDPWIAGENEALASNIRVAEKALDSIQSKKEKAPDLIVFSETSLRRPFEGNEDWFAKNPPQNPLLPFLQRANVPLLTGLPIVIDGNSNEASNSVGIIYPEGTFGQNYAKMHPVPFAEAIPFWEFAWFRSFMQNVIGLESGWVMGTTPVVFSVSLQGRGSVCVDIHALPTLRFSTPICFEDAFSGLCREFIVRGAEMLINLTNDSWSKTKSAQIQHYAVARFRAIESRKALVRSTNSGVTCVIGADGRILAELPQFITDSLVVDVPIYSTSPTLCMRWGDWFAWICAIFTGLLFCWAIYLSKINHVM